VLLLKHLVSEGQGLRALIIATYRESDLTRGHPMSAALADLRIERGVERIALRGLDEQDIVEIMERATGHELDEASLGLSRELHRETDGNPFYTGELLRHLLEAGGIYQQDSGRWTVKGALAELGLPESVREVLGRRVERLGEEAHEALAIAAVIGREFDVDLLLRVSERSEDRLVELLEEAVAASVLIESASVPGRFSFAHALINHTLYEDLGVTRRAYLHRRIAEALEQLLGAEPGARVSELALHWAKATTAVDLDKAVTYARMAGERALAELAPDEALRWFNQALELRGEEPDADTREHCELLVGLGQAQRQTGEPAFRETLLEASRIASVLADAELAARAALANNRGIFSVIGEVDRERLQAIQRAIELDDPPSPARRARLLALEAQELGWDPDFARRQALADQAISVARGAGETRTLAEVLRSAFFACWSAETLELRAALASQLSDCARTVGDPALQVWADYVEFQVFTERGEFALAEDALERVRLLAEELGQPTLKWFATWLTAGWVALRGDLVTGERLAERAFEIGQELGEPDAAFIHAAQLAYTRTYQGRAQEIVDLIEQSARTYPAAPEWRAVMTSALAGLGRRAEAKDLLKQAAADRFAHIPPGPAHLTALVLYADAAAQMGDSAAASILYELIEPCANQIVWNAAVGLGHTRMWLGLLDAVMGDYDRANHHLEFACAFQEANGLLTLAARAHLRWASVLADRGESQLAQKQAARALELSLDHGYGAFVASATAIVESRSPLTA
jgi:tetratricopeptide (TPR) repeat protein